MSYVIFQINTDHLVIYQVSTFLHKGLYINIFSKNIGSLHRKRFSKHPLCTIFSLFLAMSEVCNISNKY